MKSLLKAVLTSALVFGGVSVVQAQGNVSLDDLVNQVRQGRTSDNAENQQRIREFQANRSRQQQLLADIRAEKAREEQRSSQLEAQFETNDQEIIRLDAELQERLGDLKELFGVVQQATGDARGEFVNSLTQVQFSERVDFLDGLGRKLGQTSELASMEDMERLWAELLNEMVESGKVVTFNTDVITAAGGIENRSVTRVGLFNVVSDGKYLDYKAETGKLVELARQPQGRYGETIRNLESAGSDELAGFALDPSRGGVLGALIRVPSLKERIDQGGPVGRVIIGLGIIAILIAIWRLVALSTTAAAVSRQAKRPSEPGNNPLGRVMKVYQDNQSTDTETLELKLGEQILKETPKLNRMTAFLKIVAVVAPLLGLLGTVTGMIVTFQAITLYGTGDPQLMAGGISTALVTTVLGLCVAIPTVFLHTLVSGQAKRLTQILQEEATGMVAEQSERSHA